jgi:hypothetical protein
MKLKIEIDLDDLIPQNTPEKPEVTPLPVVHEHHDDALAERGTVWFKEMKMGEDRWYRIEGRGEDPLHVEHIVIKASPGNPDVLKDTITGYHWKYGGVVFSEYPENMYVQALKLDQLVDKGYVESRCNFPELVD